MSEKIIGKGLIATALSDLPSTLSSVCYFASGVSNSSCVNLAEFQREELMLSKTINSIGNFVTLVYFSTCSIYDIQNGVSAYVKHKQRMEGLVARCSKFLIIRLPQVVGYSNNRFTLTNYIRDSIMHGRRMKIQRGAIRNIIDVADVVRLVGLIVNDGKFLNSTVNIANPHSISVVEIVTLMEKVIHKRALCDYIEAGSGFPIDISLIEHYSKELSIDFDNNYVEKVLFRYYAVK